MKKSVIVPFIILSFVSLLLAGTYTTNLHLYKPAKYDTDYVVPFAAGMDTIDAYVNSLSVSTSSLSASTSTLNSNLSTEISDRAIADGLRVLKAGDVMTGQLTLSGSTLTITGNSFSVAGATFSVLNGRVGIGRSDPIATLDLHIGTGTTDGFVLRQDDAPSNGFDFRRSPLNNLRINRVADGISNTVMTLYRDSTAVGIGTISPQYTLDIAGNVRSTGTFIGSLTGNANTATALASEPVACPALQFVTDVAADGTLTCDTPGGSGNAVLAGTQTFTGMNTFANQVTITGNADFSNASATSLFSGDVVVSGNLNVGRVIISTTVNPATSLIAACPDGFYINSGGCVHSEGGPMYINISAPTGSTGWRCQYNNSGDITAVAICDRIAQ